MSTWIRIGRVDDIPARGARVVRSPAGDIAVFRTADDSVFAVEDRCPHRAGPLSQGIVHGTRVTCPLHDWRIELSSGAAVAPDKGCVRTYPVRVTDGSIEIDLAAAGVQIGAAE